MLFVTVVEIHTLILDVRVCLKIKISYVKPLWIILKIPGHILYNYRTAVIKLNLIQRLDSK